MLVETSARVLAVLLLPALALACIAAEAGAAMELLAWSGWLGLALAIEELSPRIGRTPRITVGTATALCLAAPVLQAGLVIYALWLVSLTPTGPGQIAAMAIMLGTSGGTIGISAAHELVHRRSALARGVAQAFMLLVSYPHFPIVHLRVHHPYVGTPFDPGTSRVNEPLARFLGRAFVLSWRSAWRIERERLACKGLTLWRWENGMLRAFASQMAVYAAVGIAFGGIGLALFLGQSVVAIFLTLAIDYTQHYGVVRHEVAPGRLERVRAHHAWTSDHASNQSTFNLGLHADHHLAPARDYAQLANAGGSLQTPFGYAGLVLLAMVPPLWYRVMNSRLPAGQGLEHAKELFSPSAPRSIRSPLSK